MVRATDRATVAIVDDEPAMLRMLDRMLNMLGFDRLVFDTPEALLAFAEREPDRFDVVLTDLNMPSTNGLALLSLLRRDHPDLPVVLMTGDATVDSAVAAMKSGAFDYLVKPLTNRDEVGARLERAVEQRRLKRRNRVLERSLDVAGRFPDIIGDGTAMRAVLRLVESVAPTDATMLILGESGTGKELVACAIHERSPRATRPFVAINCATLTDTLLESELFGHVKGAFTGATASRRGLLEEANGGTLFLDEVGDMPLGTQGRFLRVLQEGEVKPLGANDVRKVDVRVVAATNVDMQDAIKQKHFRADLFYRLNVVALELPPLRRRREDIPLLATYFLARYARQQGRPVPELTPEAVERLVVYGWPGNARELENLMHRLVLFDRVGPVGAAEVGALVELRSEPGADALASAGIEFARAKESAVEAFEHRYLTEVMSRAAGSVSEAARLAGLDRSNFRRLLRRHGIGG
jgi:DNA-binding NtrC family response regulator